jgi:CO/xanthine dehydrogenase Mo-binding subunit/aerobic-type carbon monoxide dehydrogenase small subunit (CoxS/CutS family)
MSTITASCPIAFTLNGQPFTAAIDDTTSLMDVLREQAGLISPKNGCAPQGSCGCCTVLVDGRALASCAVPARTTAGKSVVTLEGLDARERHIFAHAFSATGGLQCGFCIPGIVIRARHLIDHTPRPTRAEIAHALNNHICRCTGYVKIIDAIDLAARALQGEPLPELDFSGKVGTSLPRQDAEQYVLGIRPFIDDMKVPGMLYGAFLFSPHPRIMVKRIDTAFAATQPGVVRIVTAADVPGHRYQGVIYKDWPLFIAEGETTHCIGDMLAAVAATTERAARAAIEHIVVDHTRLPGVFSPEEALAPGAPRVHRDHENLLSTSVIRRGDVDAGLAASAFVETRTFETQLVEHAFLEPESAIAVPNPQFPIPNPEPRLPRWSVAIPGSPRIGQLISVTRLGSPGSSPASSPCAPVGSLEPRNPNPESRTPNPVLIEVFSQGQGIFDDRRQIASFLGLPEDQVRVTLVSNGGAFGGKEDLSIQGQVALMAWLTGQPVKATLTREESIRLHPKRHPMKLTYTVGCDRDGHLTAIRARIVGDKGAYASVGTKVLERAAGHSGGPYKVPSVDVEALAVYTNNLPCGAMRGFGANQAAFAIESMLDILADRAGVDPWEIRWRNVVDVGDTFCTGEVFEHAVGIKQTLLAVKDAFYSARYAGIACGIKNVGIGNGMPEYGQAVVEILPDGHITIHSGFTEMGQGFYTAMIQIFCESAGVDPRIVRVEVDTSFPTPCGMTTASRATVLGGRAVQRAGHQLREDLDRGLSLRELAGRRYAGEYVVDFTSALGAPVERPRTHLTYGFATQVCILDEQGRLSRYVAAHDVGGIINRHLVEGQIEGAVHMGLGYALTEELPLVDGVPKSFKIRSLGLLRAADMPEVTVILVESGEPEGPFGAKGVGEIGLVPTAGAVANALCRYDGIRRYTLPMKDSPAARAILGSRGSGIGIRGSESRQKR